MDKIDGFGVYDNLLDKPMADCGWKTSHISWREKNVVWKNYDAVIILMLINRLTPKTGNRLFDFKTK